MRKLLLFATCPLFYFSVAYAQQDVCLYALPAPQDSSNLAVGCMFALHGAADFNNDGMDDIITSSSFVNFSTFQTFYGDGISSADGDGYFSGLGGNSTNSMGTGAATGDFNQDGYMDAVIVTASGHADEYISNGSGGFNVTTVNLSGSFTGDPVVGDFNNDSYLDYAVGFLDDIINFFPGNGNGTFGARQTLNTFPNMWTPTVVAMDVNNDGLTDIVMRGQQFINNNGTFVLASNQFNGKNYVADLDGDGVNDVISGVNVFKGLGFGSYSAMGPINLNGGTIIVNPVDLNNDNDPDLVIKRGDGMGEDTMYVLLGSSGTSFVQSQFFLPMWPNAFNNVATGDFDGNGLQDIVLARDSNAFEQCIAIICPVMNYSANIMAPSAFLCTGDSMPLSVNANGTVLWSTGDTTATIYISSPGTYSVSINAPSGCNSSDSIIISQLNATSLGPINATDHFCYYANPVPLNSGAPAGGTYSGAGVSNGMFDPFTAGPGTHTLTYTYSGPGGCTGSATLTVTVDACLGTEEQTNAVDFSISPNPGDGIYSVQTDLREYAIDVYNSIGQLVHSSQNEKQFDLSGNAAGIYLVHISSANGVSCKPVILR